MKTAEEWFEALDNLGLISVTEQDDQEYKDLIKHIQADALASIQQPPTDADVKRIAEKYANKLDRENYPVILYQDVIEQAILEATQGLMEDKVRLRAILEIFEVEGEWDENEPSCMACGDMMDLNENCEWSEDARLNICDRCAQEKFQKIFHTAIDEARKK